MVHHTVPPGLVINVPASSALPALLGGRLCMHALQAQSLSHGLGHALDACRPMLTLGRRACCMVAQHIIAHTSRFGAARVAPLLSPPELHSAKYMQSVYLCAWQRCHIKPQCWLDSELLSYLAVTGWPCVTVISSYHCIL